MVEINIVMGDLMPKLDKCIRKAGGDKLVEFCQNPDKQDNIVRNQKSFILINDRYKNSVKSVKIYSGADVKYDPV